MLEHSSWEAPMLDQRAYGIGTMDRNGSTKTGDLGSHRDMEEKTVWK